MTDNMIERVAMVLFKIDCDAVGVDFNDSNNGFEVEDWLPEASAAIEAYTSYLTDNKLVVVPMDVVTHLHDFRHACEIAKANSPTPHDDENDALYWDHQLKVIDRIEAMINASQEGEGHDK